MTIPEVEDIILGLKTNVARHVVNQEYVLLKQAREELIHWMVILNRMKRGGEKQLWEKELKNLTK